MVTPLLINLILYDLKKFVQFIVTYSLFVSSTSGSTITIDTSGKYQLLNKVKSILGKFAANQDVYLMDTYYANGQLRKYKVSSVDTTNYKVVLTTTLPTSNFSCKAIINPSSKNTELYYPNHAEGTKCISIGLRSSHAEGYYSTARGDCSHAEGSDCIASGSYSHAEGLSCIASGRNSHAGGWCCKAKGSESYARGNDCIAGADYQTVIGEYNKESTSSTDKFIIGKGTSSTSRANCFRVSDTGVYATGSHNSTGADYAEYFEWEDGNPNNEDRRGLFVSLNGDKISLAKKGDKLILGIISGNPSVIGDSHEDQWNDMFLRDIYGTPIMEEVYIPEKRELREVSKKPIFDEDGNEIEQEKEYEEVIVEEARTEIRQKLNPDFDNTQEYIPRSERPEWAVVGMMGKLVVIDDGSCEENGWCTAGKGGIAIKSETQTKFRVMKRLDKNHVKVLVL